MDVTSPTAAEHSTHVFRVLDEIEAAGIPQILVLNKVDMLPEGADTEALERRMLAGMRRPDEREEAVCARAVSVSARSGAGVERLLAAVDRMLPVDPVVRSSFRFPPGAGGEIHLLHERARILDRKYAGEDCIVEAEAPESVRRRLSRFLDGDGDDSG